MLTEKKVRDGYFKRHGREISDGDLDAFLRLCEMFDCLNAASYAEAVKTIAEGSLKKVFGTFGVSNSYVN